MVAATGFQRTGYLKSELVTMFKDILASSGKFLEFTRKSLRGAKDVFTSGHVTTVEKEQTFRMFYDNRREIIEPKGFSGFDLSKILLDSKPLQNINQCKTLRFLSKFPITTPFNKNNTNRASTAYKSGLDIGVRNFIKAYYSQNNLFGFNGTEFKNVKDMITFISGHHPAKSMKMSLHSISKLRNRKLV